MNALFPALVVLTLTIVSPTAARAVDSGPAAAPVARAAAADTLAPARALIAQRRWRDAIQALNQANERGSADWTTT